VQVLLRCGTGKEKSEVRVSKGSWRQGFYTTESRGWPSDPGQGHRTAEISRGHRWLLGQLLAQAGGARGLLRRPARRLLGSSPGGRAKTTVGRFSLWSAMNSEPLSICFDFSEAIIGVFSMNFDIYSNLNQRDNLFREKSEF
jgi:hypothetical protein